MSELVAGRIVRHAERLKLSHLTETAEQLCQRAEDAQRGGAARHRPRHIRRAGQRSAARQLHIHTGLDDRTKPRVEVKDLIARSIEARLDVIAVTDHDDLSAVAEAIRLGSEAGISVVPGVEITTEAGHILCYAPGVHGHNTLRYLLSRVGARLGTETSFDELTTVVLKGITPSGEAYSSSVIMVGAHVDQSGGQGLFAYCDP